MPGIMADNDVGGAFQSLAKTIPFKGLAGGFEILAIPVVSFPSLKLPREAGTDRLIWETCQARDVVLFTGNRNDRLRFSEATIRTQNRPDCLPVITLSNAKRFLSDNEYGDEVAEAVLEILLDLDRSGVPDGCMCHENTTRGNMARTWPVVA